MSYLPDMSGRYTITIKYGGDEIPYSPFRIHALPTGDASKCLVTGGPPPLPLPSLHTHTPTPAPCPTKHLISIILSSLPHMKYLLKQMACLPLSQV